MKTQIIDIEGGPFYNGLYEHFNVLRYSDMKDWESITDAEKSMSFVRQLSANLTMLVVRTTTHPSDGMKFIDKLMKAFPEIFDDNWTKTEFRIERKNGDNHDRIIFVKLHSHEEVINLQRYLELMPDMEFSCLYTSLKEQRCQCNQS